MLFIIPTPIGNLKDISQRAKELLASCDILLCEDTRTTGHLLSCLGIQAHKLVSYHKHSEHSSLSLALNWLQEGKTIGLVSDAGTPCISDPGQALVSAALDAGIEVSALPGPSACITALSMSGLAFQKFQFIGFLPKEKKRLEELIKNQIALYPGVSIAYESPERIVQSVSLIQTLFPSWQLVLIKELSKLHERIIRGSPDSIAATLATHSTKGEWVILFSEQAHQDPLLNQALSDVEKLMKECDLSMKTAVHCVALLHKIAKNTLYQAAISKFGS